MYYISGICVGGEGHVLWKCYENICIGELHILWKFIKGIWPKRKIKEDLHEQIRIDINSEG